MCSIFNSKLVCDSHCMQAEEFLVIALHLRSLGSSFRELIAFKNQGSNTASLLLRYKRF